MILGIDEVGRGCLAGPLVVGAVCLDKPLVGLKDSKLLSSKAREKFNELILLSAKVARMGWVWPNEIDELGLTQSMKLAIKRALKGLDVSSYQIIIDGNINYLKHLPNSVCQIKADQTVAAVSAASIIAKVARDEFMKSISKEYPAYKFNTNVGYGTKEHILAIKEFGLSQVHRLSFNLSEKALNNL